MFKKNKTLDQILDSFIQVKEDLAAKLVSLQSEKQEQEINILVAKAEIQNIDDDMIRAAKSLQKIEEILGD